MYNIHATCVSIAKKGVLFLGDSGTGKSDMALRLIENGKAVLIADDRVNLIKKQGKIKASCPDNIAGLLEVRGIGLVKYPHNKQTTVKLVVNLTQNPIDRLPERNFYVFEGIKIPKIYLNPFESSACSKVLAALRLL